MDFSLSPRPLDQQALTRRLVGDAIVPLESGPRQRVHGPSVPHRRRIGIRIGRTQP